jgi:hypothetical protein
VYQVRWVPKGCWGRGRRERSIGCQSHVPSSRRHIMVLFAVVKRIFLTMQHSIYTRSFFGNYESVRTRTNEAFWFLCQWYVVGHEQALWPVSLLLLIHVIWQKTEWWPDILCFISFHSSSIHILMVSARSDLCPSINAEVLAQKGPAKRRAPRKYEVFVRVHNKSWGMRADTCNMVRCHCYLFT